MDMTATTTQEPVGSRHRGAGRAARLMACGIGLALALALAGTPVQAATHLGGGRPGTTGAVSVAIPKVYLINTKSFDSWDNSNPSAPPPVPVNRFTTASTAVGIYFTYANAAPRKDTFQFALYTLSGVQLNHGNLHQFQDTQSAEALLLPVGQTLTRGTYQARLLIDGIVAVRLPWYVS